jgi:thymidylate synthase ThyX
MYAAQHSPIITQVFWIKAYEVPTFVSTHVVRHHVGVSHYVKSNRVDRGGEGDDVVTRETLIQHGLFINAMALIHMAHKRLCGKASKETRELMGMIRDAVREVDSALASVMVPLCVYRNGLCDELPKPCGYNKTIKVRMA